MELPDPIMGRLEGFLFRCDHRYDQGRSIKVSDVVLYHEHRTNPSLL